MTDISTLPTEIVIIILGFSWLREVAALAATNKHLNRIASPFLYQQDTNGENPRALRWAAERGQMATFQKALNALEDVDIADGEGKTPLHYTAYCYDEVVDEMVKYLVESKAFLDAGSHDPMGTPLELACGNQNFQAAMALIRAGAEFTDGLLAICVSRIKAKSAGGLVPDEVTEESARLQEALISKLINMGAPINWRPFNEDGQTALMRAIYDGEPSTVQLLLDLGADVNSPGGRNTTPLMCAVQSRKVHCVRMLVAEGANVNLLDEDGVSAVNFLPPSEISRDTAYIWALLLRQGLNIEENSWYPEYGAISIFELAIYEALQGKSLPLDLIVEHSKGVGKFSIWKVFRSLDMAEYNPPRFLEFLKTDDKWLISSGEMEAECTLQNLQRSIKNQTLYANRTSSLPQGFLGKGLYEINLIDY